MRLVLLTEENLEQAATDCVIYVNCPYCYFEVAIEPEAEEAYCVNCRKRFGIINLFF